MKVKYCAALAPLALIAAPAAAQSYETKDQGGVSYVEALECSAVFTYLSSTGEARAAAANEERGAKWLVIAMRRDGTPDGRLADAELIPMIENLVEVLDEAPEKAGDRFLLEMIDFCETKEKVIADEFNRIKV